MQLIYFSYVYYLLKKTSKYYNYVFTIKIVLKLFNEF